MQSIRDSLHTFLYKITSSKELVSKTLGYICKFTELKEYPIGSKLLSPEQYCKHLYIIQKGFGRRYSLIDGKDITLEFAKEYEIISPTYSILTNTPSLDYIELLEESTLLQIHIDDLNNLYRTLNDASIVGKLIRDKCIMKQEQRIRSLQINSAKEKYLNLIERDPQIVQRASLGQIASYLGIAQETLSRIRRNI
ncbi:MAG: Crp/Fnr family transcriptional regulator [Marinifilaceae bacterium]|jgi:CRP-like cAMP-binding protein|nr:Crp/Fnr family transcriptional regulator [Marinifilaceae bacterium]